jgi:hypothetical protein
MDLLISVMYIYINIYKYTYIIYIYIYIYKIIKLYDKFLYSLPDKQESFKLDLKRNFNLIYDTKFIINSTNLLFNEIKNDSSLKNCF